MITRLAAIVLLTIGLAQTSQAQVALADLVEEANASWMFGDWKATTDGGSTVNLKVAWDLNKKLLVMEVKADGVLAKGFTVLEPGAELPTYVGVDEQGSVSKGNWNYEDGEIILRLETSRAYETTRKWAAVFTGNATSGLTLRVHAQESWGGLVYPAMQTMKFKKS